METADSVKQDAAGLQDSRAELPPIANPAQPPDVRSFGVHHRRGTYFIPRSKGGWYPGTLEAAKDYIIKNYGIRSDKIRTGDPLTQINDVMVSLRDLNSVVWAGSCGGMAPQLMSVNGRDILIQEGPTLIEPLKGDFPIINYILLFLLGLEQLEYFNSWMKWGHQNLLKVYQGKEGRPGQFVALVGPRGAGKNLVQERIITPVLGGRVAKPTQFFNDRSRFNDDLVGAEHWQLSDETPARDIDSRRAFGNHIKGVAANAEVRTEVKYEGAIVLRPFCRGTVSLNDEDENIRTLPPMDPSIEDKLMIFKCNFVKLPLPSGEAIEAAIASELPAYVHYLLYEHEIREELRDDRFGIKAYHHPAVLEALSATAPETQLLQEIDRDEPFNKKKDRVWVWEGSSSDLQEILESVAEDRGYSARMRMASLLKYGNTCGTYLTRLAKKVPERVIKRRGDTGFVYRIKAPIGWEPEAVCVDPISGEQRRGFKLELPREDAWSQDGSKQQLAA
jgi:hypothetical protein